jgi:hypothetical protein
MEGICCCFGGFGSAFRVNPGYRVQYAQMQCVFLLKWRHACTLFYSTEICETGSEFVWLLFLQATYHWKAGHKEEFRYERGNKTGQSVLRGASGAVRKGHRKDGQWNGKSTFTSQNGETKEEMWNMGRKV